MNVVDRLLAARDLISDPEHWAQGMLRTTDHKRHCARGALMHVFKENQNCNWSSYLDKEAEVFVNRAAQKIIAEKNYQHTETTNHHPLDALVHVNNFLGHEATMEMFDLAIREAKDQS